MTSLRSSFLWFTAQSQEYVKIMGNNNSYEIIKNTNSIEIINKNKIKNNSNEIINKNRIK